MNLFIKKEETVSCEECKCLLLEKDAQVVEVVSHYSFGYGGYSTDTYYCKTHMKPYYKKVNSMFENILFAEIKVTEDGTPIGYVKAPSIKEEVEAKPRKSKYQTERERKIAKAAYSRTWYLKNRAKNK